MSEPGKTCANCLLHAAAYRGQQAPFGFCLWFLKKLTPARAIPAATAAVGCKNWKPGKTAKAQGLA